MFKHNHFNQNKHAFVILNLDFYTMKITENSGPSQLFCFKKILVLRGSTVISNYNLAKPT